MKKSVTSILVLLACMVQAFAVNHTSLVNPLVGTDGHGHTFPGAAYPFGMVQLSPDTRPSPGDWDGCSGYHYSDSLIYGFSHTHLSGTGCDDLCDVLLTPVSSYKGSIDRELYRSPFSHDTEQASPGYYKVYLEKPGILCEMTVGKRFGVHRYTYGSDSRQLIIDLRHRDVLQDARLVQVDEHTIEGYRVSHSWADRQHVHFYIVFDTPIKSFSLQDGNAALIEFGGTGKEVNVHVGISSVSEENAKENLLDGAGRNGLRSFDRIRREAEREWESYLSKIEIQSDDRTALRTFYTALYHTAIHPSLYSDCNGEYRGMDRKIHKADFDRYTVFSIWDTFRALHPLFCIIERERTKDFIRSFESICDEAGKLPVWELYGHETNCMIGYNSVSVIADAYAKGIRGFDAGKILEAMTISSRKHEFGLDSFYSDGAVISDKEHESVSKTLEYAYDAWCVSNFARMLGDNATADWYEHYAQQWMNTFDPSTGFMRPRLNGGWLTPFAPTEVNNHFTEANSWQYSFFVPHDIESHIAALGGDEGYVKALDALFNASSRTTGRTQADITGLIGQYAHGNEPSHHIPFLYNYAGRPDITQMRVHEILTTLYSDKPDGLCGNEDCGQMSAWYVLSSLGLYSVCPGRTDLCITSPLFRKAVIRLENGRRFTITSNGSSNGIYINSVSLNGRNHTRSYISNDDIINGGKISYTLGDTASDEFGKSYGNRPHSGIGHDIITIPSFRKETDVFETSLEISLTGVPEGMTAEIAEVTDGVTGEFKPYSGPFTISESRSFAARNVCNGRFSPTVYCSLHKVHDDRSVSILSRYNPQYSGGGDNALIDGVRGTVNWRTGSWQGYQAQDFTAIVDLLSDNALSSVGAGFCQDARSWIWMPRYVDFYGAKDGCDPSDSRSFTLLGRVENTVGEQDYTVQTKDFILDTDSSWRYIKVVAKNFGTIPHWHMGHGGEGFIFVDEILIGKK